MFDQAYKFVQYWEGGFVNDSKDPGGSTKYGISFRFLKGLAPALGDIDGDGDVDADDILALTPEKVREIYREVFWRRQCLDELPPFAAAFMFDTSINMGPRRAGKILQRVLNRHGAGLVVDGAAGPRTRQATLTICSDCCKGGEVMRELPFRRVRAYNEIVARNPSLLKFMHGWLNRVFAFSDEFGWR